MSTLKSYKLIGFFSWSIFSGNIFAEVIPPGVPDPMDTWVSENYNGTVVNPLTGVAPESWEVANALGRPSYYIDNTISIATDSKNPYGSPDLPRSTIPEIEYAADSYIEIHGGPYTGGGQIIFTANGTPDKPIWVRSVSIDEKAQIAGEMIVKGQYIFIENLQFVNSKSLSLRTHNDSSLSNMVIRGMSFIGDGTVKGNSSAISIYSTNNSKRFHDFLIYNNEISYLGNDYDDIDTSVGLTEENDFHGVHPDINVDRVWVLNNKIHHLGGDSIQVGRATIPDEMRPSNVYIIGNQFYSNLENGVDIKESDSTLIMNNKIYDWRQHKNNPSTGVAIVVHNYADNTWIVNNHIADAADGIVVSEGATNTWVFSNVIEDIKHASWDTSWDGSSIYSTGSGIHFRGGPSGGALNNTLMNIDKGIETSGGGYLLSNNIIFNRNEESTYDIQAGSSKAINTTSNNLVYSENYTDKSRYIDCISCVYKDPLFDLNDQEINYKLSDVSPSIGKGTSISFLLNDYKGIFNAELSLDGAGNNRVNGLIDIGAYESTNITDYETPELPIAPVINQIINMNIKS